MSALTRAHSFMVWSKSYHGRKLIRFTMVSVVSTATSIVVIAFVYGLKIIPNEVWATVFGNVVAAIPSYHLNRRWSWGKSGKSHLRKEVVPFWTIVILGIAFSTVGAAYAHHLVHTHLWNQFDDTVTVVAANFVSFAVFWVLKLMVFNRIFHHENLDVDEGGRPTKVTRSKYL